MNPIRRAFYWFTSKHGPREGALVLRDRSVVPLNFTDPNDRAKVGVNESQAIALAVLVPKTGEWDCKMQAAVGTVSRTVAGNGTTAAEAIEDVFEKANAWRAEETALQADPVALLERALKGHNWYSHFSDDHRTYVAGRQSGEEIDTLVGEVPADVAFRLWTQHAPDDVFFPASRAPALRNAVTQDDVPDGDIHVIRKLPLCRSTEYEAWNPSGALTRVDELVTLPGWGQYDPTMFALVYDTEDLAEGGDKMPVWVPVELGA